MIKIQPNDILLITDMQNDFLPGGTLAIPGGDQIIPVLNKLSKQFPRVIASQDWHPANHISFKRRNGQWASHCVQRTPGAELHADLDQSKLSLIVRKAFDPEIEEYSLFTERSQLASMLIGAGIKRVFIGGVATDYCVRNSALDALRRNLEIHIVTDAVRGIDLSPGDSKRALDEIEESGGFLVVSSEII